MVSVQLERHENIYAVLPYVDGSYHVHIRCADGIKSRVHVIRKKEQTPILLAISSALMSLQTEALRELNCAQE